MALEITTVADDEVVLFDGPHSELDAKLARRDRPW